MSILEQVREYEKLGIKIVPVVTGDKKPVTKHIGNFDSKGIPLYEWKNVVWTEEDYIKADAGGIIHDQSNIIDVDFDDVSSIKFQHLLPETMMIGKRVNDTLIPTHMFYRYEGKKDRLVTLEDRQKKDSVIVELLFNTQTVAIGNNRERINNLEPKKITDSEYSEIRRTISKIALLTMLSKYYPKEGSRDTYCLMVAGCLARYTQWPTKEKEDFIETLCIANGDVGELKSRIGKIEYQIEQRKLDKEVYGVNALSEEIKVNVDVVKNWWGLIDENKLSEVTPITSITASELVNRNYPQSEYLLFPLMQKESLNQIWGSPGSGKTLFSLEMACAIANAQPFLKYKWQEGVKACPVLYIEGEMSATQIQERLINITTRYQEEAKQFNFELLNFAILKEQTNHTFEPLNTESGRKKVELKAEEITEKHNQKPVIFLDNISCLTDFQEKDGVEWKSLMNWLVKLRSKGYTVNFLHHATKEGSSSSGSNMKERPVDLEIKISEPDSDTKLSINETQMVIEFKKWREWNYTSHSTPFIASCSRATSKWSWHKIVKKTPTSRAFVYWTSIGKTTWKEDMKDHEEYPISKTQFYRLQKKETLEDQIKVEDDHNFF
jgi:KaiC/GvpD/RAD55 family RecA-like ATPase